jgi:hypothetical protein
MISEVVRIAPHRLCAKELTYVAANLLPIILLFLGYGLLRWLGLRLDKNFSKLRNGFILGIYLTLMLTVITAYAVVMKQHRQAVIAAWSAENHVSMAYVYRCDANGQRLSRGQIWLFSYYYRITTANSGEPKIIQIGNWLTGELGSTVTLIH